MNNKSLEIGKWILLGLVGGLVIGVLGGYFLFNNSFSPTLSSEEIKVKAEGYINENLLPQGASFGRVENVTIISGVYELGVQIPTEQGDINTKAYATKDGNLLFSRFFDMNVPQPKPPATTQPPPVEVDMKELIDDDPWFGTRDSKVIIVEFSDFQCPFCARAAPTVNQIKETYGERVLFVYRDFPLNSIHPKALKAAEAAQCAFEQEKFWEYHDVLFEKQQEWSVHGISKFKEYASDLGLETESFNNCLDSGKYSDEVLDDLDSGREVAVTGTPTFFINGEKLEGVQTFSAFQQIIDEELAKPG